MIKNLKYVNRSKTMLAFQLRAFLYSLCEPRLVLGLNVVAKLYVTLEAGKLARLTGRTRGSAGPGRASRCSCPRRSTFAAAAASRSRPLPALAASLSGPPRRLEEEIKKKAAIAGRYGARS